VVVNLISNSAVVDFVGNEHKNHIVEAIEDVGFDATVDSIVELKTVRSDTSKNNTSRTVEILVNGMYCEHCPSRVLSVLATFGKHIQVEKPLSPNDPILKVTYKPQSPDFTIRHILSTISGVDESLSPSVHHPLTLEERSRKIHERERKRILIRVMFTLVVAIPTLIIGIVYMSLVPMSNLGRQFLMRPLHAGISRAQWALFIMATPVYFLCADVFHLRALKELRSMWRPGSTTPFLQRFYRFGSMNMLMSLGTSIAYLSSVAQLIAAGVHPRLELDNNAFYFDSVVFLTLFLLTGRLIEAYSKSKTGDAVTMLGRLRPTEAFLVESRTSINSSIRDKTDNEPKKELWKKVDVDLLELGDVVKVFQGGSPPCDGVIVQGETRFDESSLTGEAKPINKAFGDDAFSGTVNKDSPVSIKITGVAGSSMLDQIVKAVREGQTRRAPMERIADTLTGYFVPFVTMTAICTWIIWLSLGYSGLLPLDYLGSEISGWAAWSIQFAIAVFVVACPCGLGLAAPTALFVGGGLAAKYGILVKGGGEAFEKASRLDCIVFDKTGTLTMGGEPVVTASQLFPLGKNLGYQELIRSSMLGYSNIEKTVYGMVHTLEKNSSHPVAKALASFCQMMEKDDVDAKSVEEIAGKGMRGRFHILSTNEELEIIVGNEHLMEESNVLISPEAQIVLGDWKSEGKSIALAAVKGSGHPKTIDKDDDDWQLAGIFAISDPIRPEAPGLIRALHKRGTDVWMLSGKSEFRNKVSLSYSVKNPRAFTPDS
jgi:Cu+-exporting ATPase